MIPSSTHLALYPTLPHPPSNTASLLLRIFFHHLRPCLKSKTKRMLFVRKTVTWWLQTSVCLKSSPVGTPAFFSTITCRAKLRSHFTVIKPLSHSAKHALVKMTILPIFDYGDVIYKMVFMHVLDGLGALHHLWCGLFNPPLWWTCELICWHLHTRWLHHMFDTCMAVLVSQHPLNTSLNLTSSDNYSKSCPTIPLFLSQQVTGIPSNISITSNSLNRNCNSPQLTFIRVDSLLCVLGHHCNCEAVLSWSYLVKKKGEIKLNMVFYHLQMLPQVCVDGAVILKLL